MVLDLIIAATVIVSLISLVGISLIGLRKDLEDKALLILVSLAAGTFLGGAFFDLIPESLESLPATVALPSVLGGMLLFFLLEKVILWHHHHHSHSNVCEKPAGYL
ncbi:MAG: ZIP family metal transporter, partial [Candidatus Micrarchaeota archaeon]